MVANFVTSISGRDEISITVGSSVVFPSVSSPSSLMSETSFVFPGLDAFTVTLLTTLPVPASLFEITYVAE